jgi:predicted dehydrogenase
VQRIKVGVIGHGHFGSFHAKQYEAHPGAALIAVADPTPAAAETARATYGDRHIADYRDMIGRVDAVSIAVPTEMHAAVARACIEAGVHVLVEKPLCPTAGEARALADFAAARGIVLHVGHIERFSATYRRLKERVAAPPLLYDVHRFSPWRGRILDVDVVLDIMIHDIDLVLDLAGSEPVEVTASGVELMGYGLDSVLARVGFASGAVAHIAASRVAPRVSRVFTVVEAKRSLTADFGANTLSVFSAAEKAVREEEVAKADSLRAEIDAFLRAVGGDKASGGVGGVEAVRALELAERIRRAAGR